MDRQDFLEKVRDQLKAESPDRYKGLVLYGSEARGEAREDSDIDLLVLLNAPISLGDDLMTIVRSIYPLQLEVLRPIHALPVSTQAYESGEFALYRNAKTEGILFS